MLYFDNINFLNIEYLFNLIFRIPEIIFNLLLYISGLFFGFSFWIKITLTIVVVFFSGILFYSLFKTWELIKLEDKRFLDSFVYAKTEVEKIKAEINFKWKEILEHLESENTSNWVMAVIESDKVLDELLMDRGYHGAGIGERLKMIPAGGLRNLDNAWEAHKIRNKIAHEPGFVLSQRDARKAINYYESVFRELGYID